MRRYGFEPIEAKIRDRKASDSEMLELILWTFSSQYLSEGNVRMKLVSTDDIFHLGSLRSFHECCKGQIHTKIKRHKLKLKRTGHNKFLRRGSTLSGVEGLWKTPPIP